MTPEHDLIDESVLKRLIDALEELDSVVADIPDNVVLPPAVEHTLELVDWAVKEAYEMPAKWGSGLQVR